MYPFQSNNIFVRNSWYVACAVDEISEKPFERTIMGQPVALFRGEGGNPRAIHGLCPHRSYPLALHGKVCGDTIQCNYHGFTFDGVTGACTSIPAQKSVPSEFRQRVYPTIEMGSFIWIWPGDPALADPSLLPDATSIGFCKGWVASPVRKDLSIHGRYMLLIENLLDLTHVAFLHGAMGEFDAMTQAPIQMSQDRDRFSVIRSMRQTWSPYYDFVFGSENRFEGMCSSESRTAFYNPGFVTTGGPVIQSIDELSSIDDSIFGEMIFHHAITPETARSAHYFGVSTRNYRHDDPAFDWAWYEFDVSVSRQDIEAAEAIEAHFQQFGEPATELLATSDVPAGRIRRQIQQRLENEERSRNSPTGFERNNVRALVPDSVG